MPRAFDPRGVATDRLPTRTMGGPIPDFGWGKSDDWLTRFFKDINKMLEPLFNPFSALAWTHAWEGFVDIVAMIIEQIEKLFSIRVGVLPLDLTSMIVRVFNQLFQWLNLPPPDWTLVFRDNRLIRYPWMHLFPTIVDGVVTVPAATWTDWKRSFHAWLDLTVQLDEVIDALGEGVWNQLFSILHIEPPDWAPINADLKLMRYPFLHLFGDTLEPIVEDGPNDPDNPDATLDDWPIATLADWARAWAAWLHFQEDMAPVWDKLGEGLWNLLFLTFGIEPPDWTRVSADLKLIRYPFMHMIGSDDILGTGVSWAQATWEDWVAAWDAAIDLWEATQIISDEFWHGVIDRIFNALNLPVPDWTAINNDLHLIRYPFMHLAATPDEPAATAEDWVAAWNAWMDLQEQFGIVGDQFWEGLYNLLFDAWGLPKPDWSIVNADLRLMRYPFIHLTEAGPSDWIAAWNAAVDLWTQLGLVDTGFWAGVSDIFSDTDWLDRLFDVPWVKDLLDSLGLGDLLDPNSLLNQMFGWLFPWLNGPTPISSLRASNPELLINPDFAGAMSLSGGDGWSWDDTVYFGAASSGSAKLIADGTSKGLVSNQIQVTAGDKLDLVVKVLTDGLAGGGSPVQLSVKTDAGVTVLASTRPTGPATGWTGAPSGAAGGELSATYEVPDGVTQFSMRLGLASGASAGTLWWDAASVKRTDGDRFSTDIAAIMALFGDLGNPQAWTDAWNAIVDIFDMFLVPTDAFHQVNPAAAIGSVQEVGDAFWNWVTHIFDPAAWTRLVDAINALVSYFIDTSSWGIPGVAGFLAAVQELNDAFWYWIGHLSDPASWTRLTAAFNAVLGYFIGDKSAWSTPGIGGFLGALQALGDAFNYLLKHLDSPSAYTDVWNKLVAVLDYFMGTAGWVAPNPSQWLTKLQTAMDKITYLFAHLLDAQAWTDAWNAVGALLGIAGVNVSAPSSAAFWSGIGGQTGATDANAWVTRLIEDATILFDMLHWIYPVGSPGDAKNQTIGGKRTWYSAWNDMLDLFDITQTTPPPAAAILDVNGAINSAQQSAATAQQTADSANSTIINSVNPKITNLTTSGLLPTTALSGNLAGSRVTVNSGALLNNWSSSVDSFMSTVFGKAQTAGGRPDYQLSTTAGTFFIPSGLFSGAPFTGNKVSHNGSGGLTFQEAGWYHFVVSFAIKWSITQYIASCCLLNSSAGLFLEGHAYANPSGSVLFNPVLQCNGLVNVTSPGQTYYAGYSISATQSGSTILFDGSASSAQLYISATKLK